MKLYTLIFIFFYSCYTKNEEKKSTLNAVDTDTTNYKIKTIQSDYIVLGDSIVTLKKEGYPQLSYKFNLDSSGDFLKSIVVYSDKVKIQKIILNIQKHVEKLELIDWNFDGYKDISILDACGSGGCTYWIWNYSPKTGKYYYNKKLSEYIGLEIDTMSKYIIFHYRAGCAQENWDTLQYKNNKLKFVKGLFQEQWTDSMGVSWIKWTREKIINNKLVIKIDSAVTK